MNTSRWQPDTVPFCKALQSSSASRPPHSMVKKQPATKAKAPPPAPKPVDQRQRGAPHAHTVMSCGPHAPQTNVNNIRN